MYAVLDVAEQVRLGDSSRDLLAGIADRAEQPDVAERSITKMLMNRAVVEKYFYSEEHWGQISQHAGQVPV